MDLPVEIVRAIVEEAAKCSPSMALHVLQLSSIIKRWVEPILYRTVTLRTNDQFDSFKLALAHDSAFNLNRGEYVLQLSMLQSMPPTASDLLFVLTRCPNLIHCAFFKVNYNSGNTRTKGNRTGAIIAIIRESVKRLSILSMHSWYDIRNLTRNFDRLTHLHVVCPEHPFYDVLRPGDLSNMVSIVIEITQPSSDNYARGIPDHAVIAFSALVHRTLEILLFLEEARNLQELLLKLQIPPSSLQGALSSITELIGTPRVHLHNEPFDELWKRPREQEVAVRCWQDRSCRAVAEVREHWNVS